MQHTWNLAACLGLHTKACPDTRMDLGHGRCMVLLTLLDRCIFPSKRPEQEDCAKVSMNSILGHRAASKKKSQVHASLRSCEALRQSDTQQFACYFGDLIG